jgi:hypothetical protein
MELPMRILMVVACSVFLAVAGLKWGESPEGDPAGSSVPPVAAAAPLGFFEVLVEPAIEAPSVDTGEVDWRGDPISVSCATCHATRAANLDNRGADDLDEFHQGLTYAHGSLSCVSCHNRGDYDTLALADGTSIPYAETITLCAQCHGPQFRDYQHGSHGGMSGYWDRTRGPRVRNHCLACHDAHAPAYPSMFPVAPPNDRFLESARSPEQAGETHE